MTRRRRLLVRSAHRVAALGVAATLVVALAQSTTTAAFSAPTSDTGNLVGSASTFCSAPGTTSYGTIGEDASTNGTGTNTGTTYNGTTHPTGTSPAGDGYLYISFGLPSVPSRCEVASATLTLYAGTSQAATMSVHRAASSWSETNLTWANQPALTGTPVPVGVPGGAGPQAFPVAAHVTALLAGPNYGFVVRDQLVAGGGSVTRYQIYNSFSNAANKPTLSITWG